jgi:hypothetical protein
MIRRVWAWLQERVRWAFNLPLGKFVIGISAVGILALVVVVFKLTFGTPRG